MKDYYKRASNMPFFCYNIKSFNKCGWLKNRKYTFRESYIDPLTEKIEERLKKSV